MLQVLHMQFIPPNHTKHFSGFDINSHPDRNSANLGYGFTTS